MEPSENKITTVASSASAEEVLANPGRAHVQNFVVYPERYGSRAPEPGDPLPVFYLDDHDLTVVTSRLDGRGSSGSEDGIVCVFVSQDESCHEVRLSQGDDEDRARILSRAIEQLTIVRDQLMRFEAVQ